MTRRVRSGNTQKHKKMPGEATKWGEFDLVKSIKNSLEEPEKKIFKPALKKSNKSHCVASDFTEGKNIDITESHESSEISSGSFEKKNSIEKNQLESCVPYENPKTCSNTVSAHLTPDKLNTSPDKMYSLDSSIEKSSNKSTVSNEVNKKNNEKDDSQLNDQQNKKQTKVFKTKKEMYLKKLQQKRAENGITLLSSKAERKLYIIKKKLRAKGVPPHVLKEIIRKERRKEEVKFGKINDPSKLCFHCRQPGHFLAGCPQKLGSSNQETGICFKCGSYNHTSLWCPKKAQVQGFPFASCFICKEQGHISKDCPSNERGVYPKGGRCNLCGNINHLRKDCPTERKAAETEEPTITLHTITKETSVDDDEVVVKRENRKGSVNKPKIVKF